MIPINIALVIAGVIIPIGMVIFWSKARKILENRFENNSYAGTIVNRNHTYKFISWLYHHKSKFDVLMASIVTIIEFLALLPF